MFGLAFRPTAHGGVAGRPVLEHGGAPGPDPRAAGFKAFADSFFAAVKKDDTVFLKAHVLFPIRNSTFSFFDDSLQYDGVVTASHFFKHLKQLFPADLMQEIRKKGEYVVWTHEGKTEYSVEIFDHVGGIDSNAKWFFVKRGGTYYFKTFASEMG